MEERTECPRIYAPPPDDPEVRAQCLHCHSIMPESSDIMKRIFEHFSDWTKVKKAVAWLRLAMSGMKNAVQHRNKLQGMDQTDQQHNIGANDKIVADIQEKVTSLKVTNIMMQQAERAIIYYIQRQYFSDEIKILEENQQKSTKKTVKKSSPLYRLDPFLQDGLLRVGGRISRAHLPFEAKHPVLLPKDHPVSKLIIRKTHSMVGHLGRNTVLAKLQENYWILGANTTIKRLLFKCVTCRKYLARKLQQKMADLPVERLQAHEPPFTNVGIDYFGPFEVKRGRIVVKRYGVIFTCLVTRAVHLEIAFTMDTNSCINAIRRFIARRGVVKYIRSDNGSNLVGACRELKKEISNWNEKKFHEALHPHNITWEFNPPGGSNFGGVWERLIRSVRRILYSLMKDHHRVDDEMLSTLFCEVESILNSRPLTKISTAISDPEALTPNHILLLRPGESVPCGEFDEHDMYVQRRWRHVQHLSNLFWRRWIKEYVPLLQQRQKWIQPQRNVEINDIVLLADNTPKNSWSLGRVVEVHKDKQGNVRIAYVQTKHNILKRPVNKLCLVLEAEN